MKVLKCIILRCTDVLWQVLATALGQQGENFKARLQKRHSIPQTHFRFLTKTTMLLFQTDIRFVAEKNIEGPVFIKAGQKRSDNRTVNGTHGMAACLCRLRVEYAILYRLYISCRLHIAW